MFKGKKVEDPEQGVNFHFRYPKIKVDIYEGICGMRWIVGNIWRVEMTVIIG